MEIGVFLLATLGMASAALSLDRHWRDLAGPRRSIGPRWTRPLRLVAIAFWTSACVLAVQEDGVAIGTLLWVTDLTSGAFMVAVMFTAFGMRRPRRHVQKASEAPHAG
ncbi:DUF3325 domain-containing protein [Nitrospirillum viridazoti]